MNSLSDYDYELPKDQIAQEPMNPREDAKLMIVSLSQQGSHSFLHRQVRDFPSYLRPTDVLVLNNTKVFKARLIGNFSRPNLPDKQTELFLLRPTDKYWMALVKPGKVVTEGDVIEIEHNFSARIITKNDDGSVVVDFRLSPAQVLELTALYGSVPVPPYIKKIPDAKDYQTAYAKITGSVAAPTAGFHLTPSLLQKIKNLGVTIVEITLHVGLGTFLPIRTNDISEHHMHSEWVEISPEAANTINRAKSEGRRVIAVGTTTTRALEGVAEKNKEVNSSLTLPLERGGNTYFGLSPFSGDVNLFITPRFQFKVIDGLLTNFHLPKSTLLLLVSAFAAYRQVPDSTDTAETDRKGRQHILAAYQEAIRENYRFYSFGDAMFIS